MIKCRIILYKPITQLNLKVSTFINNLFNRLCFYHITEDNTICMFQGDYRSYSPWILTTQIKKEQKENNLHYILTTNSCYVLLILKEN